MHLEILKLSLEAVKSSKKGSFTDDLVNHYFASIRNWSDSTGWEGHNTNSGCGSSDKEHSRWAKGSFQDSCQSTPSKRAGFFSNVLTNIPNINETSAQCFDTTCKIAYDTGSSGSSSFVNKSIEPINS
jgi:hypothetical protein